MPKQKNSRLQDGMATALSLDHWSAPPKSHCDYDRKELSVNFLCMDQAAAGAPGGGQSQHTSTSKTSITRAARFQEIFLDLVGWHASRQSSSRFLLDDRFDSILSPGDKELKDGILELMKSSGSSKNKNSQAHKTLCSLLEDNFGYQKLDFQQQRRIERLRGLRTGVVTPVDDTVKTNPPCDEATFSLRRVTRHITRVRPLRQAAALSEIDPTDTDQLKNFISEKLPDCQGSVLQSIPGAAPEELAEFHRLFRIPGHVFVCNSSVCELSCDVFLCPAAISEHTLHGRIWSRWCKNLRQSNPALWGIVSESDTWNVPFHRHADNTRVALLDNLPIDCGLPIVLPTDISMEYSFVSQGLSAYDTEKHLHCLMESVRQFLDTAYSLVKDNDPLNRRERHLFALPVIGTGGGGAGDLTGEIVRNLLKVLHEFVAEHDVDAVIVAADEATYAHAQSIREEPTSILDKEKMNAAEDLAKLAASGHLSLFLGAGTSIAAGLPSWFGLLGDIEDLFNPTGNASERCVGDSCNWDPLTMADELERIADSKADRNGLKLSLKRRVAKMLQDPKYHPSLVLALLVSLPSKSIVTTNYDELIEQTFRNRNIAEQSSDTKLSILPHKPIPGASEWLLKLHGCVSHPDRIVLSGKDYAQRKVLAGIVQANLLTTHLLFCGFSLTDPNYLKILKEVRAALHPADDLAAATVP